MKEILPQVSLKTRAVIDNQFPLYKEIIAHMTTSHDHIGHINFVIYTHFTSCHTSQSQRVPSVQ